MCWADLVLGSYWVMLKGGWGDHCVACAPIICFLLPMCCVYVVVVGFGGLCVYLS